MANSSQILVTGAAGYVGKHVMVELIQAGYIPIALDNREPALSECAAKIEAVTGHKLKTYLVDLLDKSSLDDVFKKERVDHVLHLAGLKAVRESHVDPISYYKVNVIGSINLFEVMKENGMFSLMFSSSSKVYGEPQYLPLDENHPTGNCTNPYGRTKYMVEQILQDIAASDKRWNITILRYFNPCGAHSSGILSEDCAERPRNLMPCICHVAQGKMEKLKIFGHDYETPDGTAVKGYTHVVDLAKGHILALKTCQNGSKVRIFNMGTDQTHSILDMVKMFEQVSGEKIPVELCDRKDGEIAMCSSDSSKAFQQLGWKSQQDLKQMCEDVWHSMTTNHGTSEGSLA